MSESVCIAIIQLHVEHVSLHSPLHNFAKQFVHNFSSKLPTFRHPISQTFIRNGYKVEGGVSTNVKMWKEGRGAYKTGR